MFTINYIAPCNLFSELNFQSWEWQFTSNLLGKQSQPWHFDWTSKEDAVKMLRSYILRYMQRDMPVYFQTCKTIHFQSGLRNVQKMNSLSMIERYSNWIQNDDTYTDTLKFYIEKIHPHVLNVLPAKENLHYADLKKQADNYLEICTIAFAEITLQTESGSFDKSFHQFRKKIAVAA